MLILVSCLVIFVYGLLSSLLGTIIPELADKLSLSNLELGYIALAQGLGLAGISVVAGALIDKKGKKVGVVAGLTVTLGGLLMLASSWSLAVTILAMFLLGSGGSLVIVSANAIASDVSDERRAAALNFLNVFSGLGGLATPFIAGNFLGSNPEHVAIFGIAASSLVLCVVLFTPMRKPEAQLQHLDQSGGRMFTNPALYLLSAVTFLYTACEFGIWNWLPKYLISTGVTPRIALNVLSLGFASGLLLGRVVATSLLWKLSPLPVTIACSAAMAATTFMVLHPMSTRATVAAVFLTGFVMAPVFPTTIAIVGRLFKRRSATAIGFSITCGFSGLMVSSPVIGWLSGTDPKGIAHGLMLLPVLSLLMFAILVGSGRVFRKEEERFAAMVGPHAGTGV